MKDHDKRELVNKLRDDANKYANTPRLREVMARHVLPLCSEITRLQALADATEALLSIAGPRLWDDPDYFRAADKCNQLLMQRSARS